jgi:hypothetical protein
MQFLLVNSCIKTKTPAEIHQQEFKIGIKQLLDN